MDVGKIFRQLEAGGAQAAADEPIEHLHPLLARGLAILVVKVGQIDEAVAAALDDELLGIVIQLPVAADAPQLVDDQPGELVAAGRTEEVIEPSHRLSFRHSIATLMQTLAGGKRSGVRADMKDQLASHR